MPASLRLRRRIEYLRYAKISEANISREMRRIGKVLTYKSVVELKKKRRRGGEGLQ